ncbi:MAG: DUF5317 family protein [Mycobacteriales bacterium]
MALVVCAVVVAFLAGLLVGGRLAAIEELEIAGWQLLVAAFVAQLGGFLLGVAGLPAGWSYGVGTAVSAALMVAFLVRNRQIAGAGLIALGLLLNALVILLNGAMPVSAHAADKAGVHGTDDVRHERATGSTVLRPAGDVIPVPLPGVPEVVSAGDVLVAAGLAQFVFTALSGAQPARPREPRPARPPRAGRAAPTGGGPPKPMPNAFATPSPHVVQATLEEEPVEPEPPGYAGEYQPPGYQPPGYQTSDYQAPGYEAPGYEAPEYQPPEYAGEFEGEYEAYEPPALGPDRLRAARPACWTDLDGPPAGGAWVRRPPPEGAEEDDDQDG